MSRDANYSANYDSIPDRDSSASKKGNPKGKKRNRKNNKGYKGNTGNRNTNRYSNGSGARSSNNSSLSSGLYADNSRSARNDIDWYTKNPELIAVAARLATPYRPGTSINLGPYTHTSAEGMPYEPEVTIPGVMTLDFVPTVGYSTDTNSPASICAARMWAQIRSHFSSDLTVDPADLFMYIYAIGQVHAYIESLKRIYRAVNTYSQDNYDYPKNVLFALMPNLNASTQEEFFSDLKRNRVYLYTQINEMVNAINVFRVPDQYPILHRMRWLNAHVYLDEDRPNAQTYVFRQTHFYYIDTDDNEATMLKPLSLNATYSTVDDLVEVGWALIQMIQNWEDAYTINGYIARAWEGSNALIESYLSEYEVLAPVYNREVLHQIENANLCPVDYVGNVVSTITQDPDTSAIIHTPGGRLTYNIGALILNCHDRNTDADNIIGTRLMCSATVDPNGISGSLFITGTEVITSIRVTYKGARLTHNDYTILNVTRLDIPADGYTVDTAIPQLERLRMFLTIPYWHHHPTMYVAITHGMELEAGSDAQKEFSRDGLVPICDLDQPTRVDFEWLKQLHRITMYSLFNVFNKSDVISRDAKTYK